MSILMDILQEELDRLADQQIAYEEDLKEIPKGYISKKCIYGRERYYLQYREDGKICSKYIPNEKLPALEEQIRRGKHLKASLRRVKEDQKKLRKVLRKKNERSI